MLAKEMLVIYMYALIVVMSLIVGNFFERIIKKNKYR